MYRTNKRFEKKAAGTVGFQIILGKTKFITEIENWQKVLVSDYENVDKDKVDIFKYLADYIR